MKLTGKTVLLTGSGSGIGSALAELLVTEGAHVIGFDLQPAKPRPGFTPFVVDITDPQSINDVLPAIDPPIDILINNAGVMRRGTILESAPEDFDLLMNVHVKGSWLMCKHLDFLLAPDAVIIQMLSRHALTPPTDPALYAFSKICADHLLDFVAMDHPAYRIVRLYPGPTDTPLARHGIEGEALKEKEQRMIAPEALAKQIVTLLQEDKTRLEFEVETGEYRMA